MGPLGSPLARPVPTRYPPVYRRFARAAVEIYLNVHAPIERRAKDAFKLVNDMLTIMVGSKDCISTARDVLVESSGSFFALGSAQLELERVQRKRVQQVRARIQKYM